MKSEPKPYGRDISDTQNSLGYTTRICSRLFDRVLQWSLLEYDLQIGHWYFLRALWQREGITQKTLSSSIHLTESTTVIALNGMEKRGLVRRERSNEDRRKILVYLTDYGKSLREELLPLADRLNAIAAQGLSEQEIETYLSVAQRMRENLSDYFDAELAERDL